MPIQGVEQPKYIQVNNVLRLRKYDGRYDFAYDWYQDSETCLMVNGVTASMKQESITIMYEYLNAHGELYFIEYLEDENYIPIGDVTFWKEDMPIVIGNPAYRKRGIGYLVVKKLMERARELRYEKIYVDEIYDYNKGSIRCFEKAGFMPYERTEKGKRYCADFCESIEQLDIERINSYEDNRFSEKVLKQHGAFVVNGVFFYEVLIIGTSEAVITGENRKYYKAVIEYFRFFAEHVTIFRDAQGNIVKEYPKVELFEIPLKNIQPSQFYVDKSKKKEVSTFIHAKEDAIIPLKKFGNEIVSMDGHTRMAVAAEKGLDTVLAFWSAEEADYLEYFVTEAQKRNIYTPYDLTELEHDEYEEKWNGFCDAYFAQGDE